MSAKKAKQKKKSSAAKKTSKARGRTSTGTRRRKLELKVFRDLLHAERDRLTKELEEIENRTSRRGRLDAAVEEQDFDENPGDAASETLERGTELALERNIVDLLEQIQLSLSKIEDGSYGVCDYCGRAIAERRLKALPYATLCIQCKDRMECG